MSLTKRTKYLYIRCTKYSFVIRKKDNLFSKIKNLGNDIMNELIIKENLMKDMKNALMNLDINSKNKEVNITSQKDYSNKYTGIDENNNKYTVEETSRIVEVKVSPKKNHRYQLKESSEEIESDKERSYKQAKQSTEKIVYDEYGNFKGVEKRS